MRGVLGRIPLKYSAPALAVIALLLITPQILQNTPPTAKAKATPQVADIGQTITFDARESDGIIVDYEWIFHDGTVKHGAIVQHAFQKPGIYHVTLIVTANNGLTNLTTVKVVVKNDPPKAKITAKTIAYEGEEITFDASQTLDSDIDLPNLKYYWDFGDGYVAEGKIVSHTYRVSGTYTVTLKVEDDQGFIDMETIYVTILNKPPEANAEADKVVVYEGEEIHFHGYTVDTEYENLTYLWDFGDGTYAFTKDATHTYCASGTYTVKFMVRDEEGEISSDTITVEVLNKPPTVSIKQKNIVVEEGKTIIVETDVEDTPTDTPLITYEWSNGAGGWRRPYIWPDDWSGEIWVRATDDDGATSMDRATVQVVNVDPEASIIECYAIANITFRVAGGPNATIEVKLIRDNQTLFAANITRTHCGPQNITLLLNGKMDLTSIWMVEARYVQNYPPCGSNPVWVIMEFSNGAWRKIHHVFNPRHNETYEWRVILNDYIIRPFPEVHECDCGCCCGYDLEYYGDPEIFFVGKGFDRGMDNLTFLWYINGSPMMMEVFDAMGYPMLAESLFSWEIGYPTKIGLRVTDDDGGASGTCIVDLLKQNITMIVRGVTGRIEITNHTESVKEYEIFYATTNITENITIIWSLDGDILYGPGITYTWNESGTYVVKIYRNISGEPAFLDAVRVEVYNAPPEILEPGEVILDEGAPINFALSAIDTPNDQQKLRILWIFPEGYRDTNISTNYVFWRSGIHTITLHAVDDDGATATLNVSIEVVNKPPIAEKKEYTATMDKSITMTCIASDTPYDKFYLQYRWIIGGKTIIDGYDMVHIFTKPGKTQVRIIVTDDDGDYVETSINVTVENPPPTINIPEEIIYYGPHTPIPINTTTVDTPTHEGLVTMEWTVYYDGQAQYQDHQIEINVEKTGEYIILITAKDPDGGTTQKKTIINITLDNDGDGITNEIEKQLETNPNAPDTDGDYLLDPEEIVEGTDGYITNPKNPDTDGDGLYDGYSFNGIIGELSKGTSPVDNDTDNDGLGDGLEVYGWNIMVTIAGEKHEKHVFSDPLCVDSDSDGLNDTVEYILGTDPSAIDTDGDGIGDFDEVYVYGSNPSNSDSDEDMLEDGDEISRGLSPIDPDSDDDGLKDGLEIRHNTDPINADTDGDGLPDGAERAPIISYEAEDFAVSPELITDEGVMLPKIPWGEIWHYEKIVEFYIYDIMDVEGLTRMKIPYTYFLVGLNITYFTNISYNERQYLSYVAYGLEVKVIAGNKKYVDGVLEYITWPTGWYKPYYVERFRGYIIYLPIFTYFPKIRPDMKIEVYGFRRPTVDEIYVDNILICYPASPRNFDSDGDGLSDGEEFWYGASPVSKDTDNDNVDDKHDTNPLENARLHLRITKFSYTQAVIKNILSVDIVEIDVSKVITFSNIPLPGITIGPFDIPDHLSSVRIRIDAGCLMFMPPYLIFSYYDLSVDRGSDFYGRTLELKVDMRYGYRFSDPTSSWDDDWTQFTTTHPINDPSQTVNVTIIDKSGYGYASGYEDNTNESFLIQGEIWFETIVEDCDGLYWKITTSSGNKIFHLAKGKDGLPFWLEADYTHTSPGRIDTDGDGVSDAWEDSDGDGAFNIQELIIGKNPAERDVFGIHLHVSLEFPADNQYISRLKEAFYLASRYIYDYTDGYAFISHIIIYNNSIGYPQYLYDVIIKINANYLGFALGDKVYINGDLISDSPPPFAREYNLAQRILWFAAVLGHELGHSIFKFDDEYIDENWTSYNSSIGGELWLQYHITTVHHLGNPPFELIPPYREIYVKELSWYRAYKKFWELWSKYPDETTNVTAQWKKWTTEIGLKYGFEWYCLVYNLTRHGVGVALYINDTIYVFTGCADILTLYIPLKLPELVILPKVVIYQAPRP